MAKNIVLCADGTWNTPHGVDVAGNTNVRQIYMALVNSPDQLKYYDSGVGTDGTPIDHLIGGAMGEGLFQKVQDCYAFLGNVYDPGDKIYLFGFSRGAFTARSVGGMIAAFGVPSINLDNRTVVQIFDAYRIPDEDQRDRAKLKLTMEYGLLPVSVEMIGVWDTVGSMGIPGLFFNEFNTKRYGFLDTTLHECVLNAYHAVSIDERRAQFKPTLWTGPNNEPLANTANVQQVWFSGVHCDVGGSYAQAGLSNIALSWMVQKAKKHDLKFADDVFTKYTNPDPAGAEAEAHDEWKFVPYGIPEHRTVPSVATMSNTVQNRLSAPNSKYGPENITFDKTTKRLTGYSISQVLPYEDA